MSFSFNFSLVSDALHNSSGAFQNQQNNVHGVAIVGPGNSGKTCILNRIRQIHWTLKSEHPMEIMRMVIRKNIIKYMNLLCIEVSDLGMSLHHQTSIDRLTTAVNYAQSLESGSSKLTHPDCVPVIQNVKFLCTNEPTIKECLQYQAQIQIRDNVSYFFNSHKN